MGGAAAWVAYQAMPKRNGPDDGPPLVLGLTMFAVTVVAFRGLRWASGNVGFPVTFRDGHEEVSRDELPD